MLWAYAFTLLEVVEDEISIQCDLRLNDGGQLTLVLPCTCADDGTSRSPADYWRDYRIELVLEICDCNGTTKQVLYGNAPFFIKKVEYCLKQNKCSLSIQAEHATGILRKRLVAYRPKTNEARAIVCIRKAYASDDAVCGDDVNC